VDKRIKNRFCEINGCDSKHYGKGYCQKHYSKYRKYGNPLESFQRQSIEERLFSKYAKNENGCWIFAGYKDKKGYGHIGIAAEGSDKKRVRAHRLSYSLFVGEIPDGMMICHRCDTPSCINPDHLFVGTAQDNTDDMFSKNRWKGGFEKGVRPAVTKFTEQDILRMKELYQSGVKQVDIAKEYRTSQGHISNIILGRAWK
jgi:HNH endonuclease